MRSMLGKPGKLIEEEEVAYKLSHSSISGNQDVTKLETAQSQCEHHGFVTLDLRCCFQSKFRKTGFA